MTIAAPAGVQDPPAERACRLVVERFARSIEVPQHFFESQADAVSLACCQMARRFQLGGRLLVFGEGAAATDAQHVAVEFVHPVLVGKRALPAVALPNDVAVLTGGGPAAGAESAFADALGILGRPNDMAMGISGGAGSPRVLRGLERAREMGLLTLALLGAAAGGTGEGGGPECGWRSSADGTVSEGGGEQTSFVFAVSSSDPLVVQEVHETLYHVLWELVHVFFEHRAVT
ncbi:MAG: SIS domain-containing protein [Gemmatimonadota bacterium]